MFAPPDPWRPPNEDDCTMEGSAMALAFASMDFCMRATFLVSTSREALRLSPIEVAQDEADDDGEDGV